MVGKQSMAAILDAKAQGKISDSFKRFADIHLSRHAAELKSVFCQPLGDRYRDQLPRLTRDIDSILLLAGYYDPVVAQARAGELAGAASRYCDRATHRN